MYRSVSGIITATNGGVEMLIMTNVASDLAELTNSMLNVLAKTSSIR